MPFDPFRPDLKAGTPVLLSTDEQKYYIRKVLDISCSDSKFAEKAYIAIARILNGGVPPVPTLTSLNPNVGVIGSPAFTMHVMGTNFTPESVIVFNGYDEPTTFISSTEITTGINMPLWQAPVVVPVKVRNEDGSFTSEVNFTFAAA